MKLDFCDCNDLSHFVVCLTCQAGLKIIQLYMEGYRQDWKLSFEEDTVKRGGWYVNYLITITLFMNHH